MPGTPVNAGKRLSPEVIERLRKEIETVGGNEVFAVGTCNDDGIVVDIVVAARGNKGAVPVISFFAEGGDVLLHNHPGGTLTPSDADLAVASSYAEAGLGFFIVDNAVRHLYPVTEPVARGDVRFLDVSAMEALFHPGGAFPTVFPRYEVREQQVEMMREVADGFNHRKVVVVEAGTGVGKSVAYLIPAFYWCDGNDERVVISTATINLQQQLQEKDLPLVRKITGLDVRSAVVKGRQNYLCLRRLKEVQQDISLFDRSSQEVAMLATWASTSPTGTRSDFREPVSTETWMRVCSESDSCRGLLCPDREQCFVLKARRAATSAQILITNHHLLFSDLAIRRRGMGRDGTAVLPPFHHIIFDEAHNMERNATSFFSERFDRVSLFRNLSLLHRTGSGKGGKTGGVFHRLMSFITVAKEGLVESFLKRIEGVRRLMDDVNVLLLERIPERAFRVRSGPGLSVVGTGVEQLSELRIEILRTAEQLGEVLGSIPEEYGDENAVFDATAVVKRLQQTVALLDDVLHFEEHPDRVFWIEKRRNARGEVIATFHSTPLYARDIIRESVFETYDTVVCTSATLSVRGTFDFFSERVGIDKLTGRDVAQVLLDSPFAYGERVLLAAVTDGPLPNTDEYQPFVEAIVAEILELSEGRGLVLFTSYNMLEKTYHAVSPRLAEAGITVLRQGEENRSKLLERFASDTSSVLFATDSFWEGVDTPGDALLVVIICKLPFRVPNDPVFEAQVEAIEHLGGSGFYELSLPHAVMKLKQGFGRLMRRKSDRGVVVILDPRIAQRNYGRFFVLSLPETQRSFRSKQRMLQEVEEFLYRD